MLIIMTSRSSSKLGHVGSKTRSLGQILEKPCVHSSFYIRLNHNKGSKSVPLLLKNQLSYTPFILLPQVHSTFPKHSDIQLLSFIFYTTLKLLPTWLSQTLQICEESYFMLKIVAKTPRISLYSSYLHI